MDLLNNHYQNNYVIYDDNLESIPCRSIWCCMFPEVSFTDKVVVIYKDGVEEMIKHLYFNNQRLHEIDWSTVDSVYEV
jgi:hypothetical protein